MNVRSLQWNSYQVQLILRSAWLPTDVERLCYIDCKQIADSLTNMKINSNTAYILS